MSNPLILAAYTRCCNNIQLIARISVTRLFLPRAEDASVRLVARMETIEDEIAEVKFRNFVWSRLTIIHVCTNSSSSFLSTTTILFRKIIIRQFYNDFCCDIFFLLRFARARFSRRTIPVNEFHFPRKAVLTLLLYMGEREKYCAQTEIILNWIYMCYQFVNDTMITINRVCWSAELWFDKLLFYRYWKLAT